MVASFQVSIIIVNYNTRDILRHCLESIYTYTKDISYEIIVVDNASTDGSCEMIKDHFSRVKLIESPENLGFGRANNLGFSHSTGETLLFLNSDTLLIDNSIKILYDFLIQHPQTGVCGGILLKEDMTINHSFGYQLTIKREVLSFFNSFFVKSLPPDFYNTVQEVDYITGADMMVSRKVMNETQGFDPDFFLYYEETELSFRIKKRGYQIKLVPQARIIHLKGESGTKKKELNPFITEETWFSRFLYFQKVYNPRQAALLFFIYQCRCKLSLFLFSALHHKNKIQYWNTKYNYITRGYKKYKKLMQEKNKTISA